LAAVINLNFFLNFQNPNICNRFVMHLSGMFSFSTFQHVFGNISDAFLLLSGPIQWNCLCRNSSMQFSGAQPRFFIELSRSRFQIPFSIFVMLSFLV